MSIGNSKVIGELEKKGCPTANKEPGKFNLDKKINHMDTTLNYFPYSSKVLIRNEINLYKVSSFFADFGGHFWVKV